MFVLCLSHACVYRLAYSRLLGEVYMALLVIGVFAENFGWLRFAVVCFLHKANPNQRKNMLLSEKVAQLPL